MKLARILLGICIVIAVLALDCLRRMPEVATHSHNGTACFVHACGEDD